ncbi:MAG: PEP-CTERM sorting domain-containing protein [Candidatus Latescibacteria bacterium]|nr:PEP-CTERM sorting domain-containing protein [Candidatus Latescibacterota bacterium]NIO00953.1 PEP-CTERM sorting domain-containing protein [Candidatus Latescibacterota bacterium]NIO27352.1 PEP-CTERM sorting domain-containing protein [Candidatus Latescibacterota bacterium]NIO54874.1 PEP-CTERM sorting domain-containing protein [Candidatus Latescibacterota bacterium]NIT00963.1 PEP-CTERM sorting domain-containing protein [Candidatus Latescibacterota bacterium]
MRRLAAIIFVISITALLAGSASAVPRLQTYIVGAEYGSNGIDNNSWVTHNSSFDLKVAGYWQPGIMPRPRYDFMSVGLVIGVPQNETGAVWINGVKITSFYNVPSRLLSSGFSGQMPMKYARINLKGIGMIDNNQTGAWHYNGGVIQTPGWGDEILLNVAVENFTWSHFGALGVSRYGRLYYTSDTHDAGYYRGGAGFATPEPGTLSLLGLGLLGLAPFLKKKKRR